MWIIKFLHYIYRHSSGEVQSIQYPEDELRLGVQVPDTERMIPFNEQGLIYINGTESNLKGEKGREKGSLASTKCPLRLGQMSHVCAL